MIKIITSKKVYIWNYKRCFRNLLYIAGIVYFIIAYLVASRLDYAALIK